MIDAWDIAYLERAIALAKRYVGQTAPNPPVGAVIVRDDTILGEGAHQKAGEPHAEVNAVRASLISVREATLYVTLEPCSTTGRTPPCCDLILKEGLRRVVIGTLDPNPAHAGRAVDLLRAAGVCVDIAEGPIARQCATLIEPFAKRITQGLPWVRLKLAMTLDGAIADREGSSFWITGPEARERVQEMRQAADAIMVGAGTVHADHPSLQPRLSGATLKRRILVNSASSIEARDRDALTWVATEDLGYDGHDLVALMRTLAERGVMSILCEGGGLLANALLDAGLVDELCCFYAPTVLGDNAAKRGFAGSQRLLAEAHRLALVASERIGEDILLTLRPRK